MRVADKRWGEVIIRKQGAGKNKFDKSKSFSIIKSNNEYSIEQIQEIIQIATNLTDGYDFEKLKAILETVGKEK